MKAKHLTLAVALVGLISANTLAQKLEVNSQSSTIEWLGSKLGGEHTGNINLKTGSFTVENNKIVSGSFVMDMNSITNTDIKDATLNQKLVGHLKSDDFFSVEKYPESKFEVTNSTSFSNGKATLTGEITIKGITETITFDISKNGKNYSAKIDLDRSKFNVRYGSNSFFDNLGDSAISDIFTLTINLMVK